MIAHTPSLWLVPQGADSRALAATMEDLRERHGGPPFAPHLTLLGGLGADELLEKTAGLARGLSPIELTLTRAAWGTRWFQCVYLSAAPTPGLLSARQRACAAFDRDPDAAFLPHVSLLYGDLPAGRRAEICRSLRPPLDRLVVRELQLVATVGPAEEWTVLGRFPLTARTTPPDR